MIPKTIHYCWFGGKEKPKLFYKCLESWKKFCPEFEIIEWNENNIDFSIFPDYTKQAYDKKVWGFVPDYIRLWIIYTYGGIYLDTDVEIRKDISPLLVLDAYVGRECAEYVNLGVGFGAKKGNQFLKELMDLYWSLSFVNADGTINSVPSPRYSTDVLMGYGLNIKHDEYQTLNNVTVLPSDYLSPKNFITGKLNITDNTYTIHHFAASWFNKEQRKRNRRRRFKIKMHNLTHTPNRVMKRIIGEDRYNKLKKKLKNK